jgi:hypothetical protein
MVDSQPRIGASSPESCLAAALVRGALLQPHGEVEEIPMKLKVDGMRWRRGGLRPAVKLSGGGALEIDDTTARALRRRVVNRDRCGGVRRVIWCPFYRVGEAAGGVRQNSSQVGRGREGGTN